MELMRFAFVALLIAGTAAWGQYVISPERAARMLAAHAADRPLRCEVIPIPAQLSFSFRFQAGYVVRVPMKQYFGPGHRWTVLVRVTPERAQAPIYLSNTVRLPNIPKTKNTGETGGVLQVGEGRYAVDWEMFDETNRVCRKTWKIEAKLDARERGLNLGLAPGAVSALSYRRWSARESADARPLNRLTVLLHAAPLVPRSLRFRAQDRVMLLGSLVALLEALPAHSVRLVVFNLDQQKELFRHDDLTPETFDQVAQSTNDLQLQVVDYRVLGNRRGHVSLLADLINQELHAEPPSDAVIFLGPSSRFQDKFPEAALEQRAGSTPQFFYFQYKPNWGRGAEFPDSVEFAIKRVRGKTSAIHTPDEFARAIRGVENQMSGRN
jgi:hypothetical protein